MSVGYRVNVKDRTCSHKPLRTWAIYKSCRFLCHNNGATGRAVGLFIGHLVSFFLLDRAGL
eukprot:14163786-Heterocapsa_arctica.AAC.1